MLRCMTLTWLMPDSMVSRRWSDVPEEAWSDWAEFLQLSEQCPLNFPALEKLCLDFSAWCLQNTNENKIRVCTRSHGRFSPQMYAQCLPQVEPFLRKLRPSGGLRHLLIFGIEHKQNLNDFKHGFVKQGGRFQAIDRFGGFKPDRQTILADEIVSYSNLHTVSKGVRDILQRDGVPALIL